MQVYTEVAERVQNISDTERIAVYEGLAGKYHISRLTALLDDLGQADSMYKSMYESSKNSAGSAMDENEKFMKSLQARINLARVEVEKLALAFGDAFLTEGMIQGIKVFGDFLSAITKFTEKFGALPLLFATAGTGIYLLSSRFRGLIGALATSTASMLGFSTAARTTAASTTAATASVRTFSTVAKTALAGTGVGLGFVALGAGVELLLGNLQKQREIQEEIARNNQQLAESYTQNRGTIEQLSAEYSNLEEAMKVEPDLNTQERYYDVQNELAALMPSLVAGEDSYGNKLLISATAIESRIGLIEKQVEAEQRLQDVQNAKDTEAEIKAQQEAYKKNKEFAEMYLDSVNNVSTGIGQRYDYDIEAKSLQDMEKALGFYIDKRKELIDSGLTDKHTKVMNVDKTIETMEINLAKYQEYSAKMESAQAYLAANYTDNASRIISENNNISKSVKGMTTDILYDISGSLDSLDQIEPITNLFGDIGSNDQLIADLDKLDKSISDFKNNTEDDFSTLEASATTSFTSIKDSILSASGFEVDSAAYDNLANGIDNYTNKVLISEKAIRDYAVANNTSVESARAQAAAAASVGDGAGVMADGLDDATDSTYELKDAIDLLTGVNQQLVDDSDELAWMYEMQTIALANLKEGTDEYAMAEANLNSTKERLIALYPHLFSAEQDALELTDDKIAAIEAEVNATDVLRAAYKASMDGKLTSEQTATTANLAQTNERIKVINTEIRALEKLVAAYAGADKKNYERVKKAAEAGEEGAASALMRMTQPIGAIQMLEAELATATASRGIYVTELSKIPEVMERSTTRANKAISEAQKEYAKATDAATKAQEKNAEAIEKSTYLADKYKQALDKLNQTIDKQAKLTQKFPDYSYEYRQSLQKEIELQKEKGKLLEDQAKSLENQIKSGDIIRYGVTTTTVQGASTGGSKNLAGWNGKQTSAYGWRSDPFTGQRSWHGGVDIKGNTGDRLDANVNGTVRFAGNAGNGFGNYVMVQAENGIKHIYAHLSKVAVKIGDKVATGMKLGEIGSTGRSTGSHLHYETRNNNNQSIDPTKYLAQARAGVSGAVAGSYTGKYATEINKAAATYGVDPNLIAAMIQQESGFNPRAVSHAGAKGLMQLMPATARGLGVKDSFNPEQNIMGGTKYIAQQLKAFGGDIEMALAAYNAGPGNVRKYGGIPPFAETQKYVPKVLANYNALGGASSGSISAATAKEMSEVSKDQAATLQAIDEAKSQLLGLKGDALATQEAIEQMQIDIVMSQVRYYQHHRETHDRSLAHLQKDMERLDATSVKYIQTFDKVIYQLEQKQRLNNKELNYLNKMVNSGKLNAAVTDQLRLKMADLKIEMKALNTEMANMKMDAFTANLGLYDDRIDDLQHLIDQSKSYASTLSKADSRHSDELWKQYQHMRHQEDLLIRQRKKIEQMMKSSEITEAHHKQLSATLEDIIAKYWEINLAMREHNTEIADNAISAMKEVYEKQKEHALDAIEKERTAYQKMIDEKLKLLDEQAEKEDFLRNQGDKQESMSEIQDKIDLLMLDDSQFAKAERAKLLKELEEMEKEYQLFMRDHEREQRKKALEEDMEDKNNELDKKEEETTKYFDNILADERRWADMQKDIMNGVTNAYVEELAKMEKWSKTHLKSIGDSIGKNLLDTIREASTMLEDIVAVTSDGKLANQNKKDEKTVEWEQYYKNEAKRKTMTDLNLRTGAGHNNESIMVIPKGKSVDYQGVKKNGWAQVRYNGKTGYVNANYLTKFKSGGYTGDNVPSEGALAILHKKEQVLNEGDTTNLFKTIDLMNKLHSKLKIFKTPTLNKEDKKPTVIDRLIHIDNFNGTQKEVDSLSNKLVSALSKRGVTVKR